MRLPLSASELSVTRSAAPGTSLAKTLLLTVSFGLVLTACGGDDGPQPRTLAPERSVQLVPTTDPAELEAFLKAGLRQSSGMTRDGALTTNGERLEDATAPVALENDAGGADAAESSEFSTTNLQESGVDQADLVKYDGDFLYIADNYTNYQIAEPMPLIDPVIEPVTFTSPTASPIARLSIEQVTIGGEVPPSRIIIARTQDGPAQSETVSTITLEPSLLINGLYLFSSADVGAQGGASDRLVVVGNKRERCSSWSSVWCWQKGNTTVLLYDVSAPETPALLSHFETDAHRIGSRRVGDKLLLTTRYAPTLPEFVSWVSDTEAFARNESLLTQATLQELMPRAVVDGAEQALVAPENCFIPPQILDEAERPSVYRPTLVAITQLDLSTLSPVASVCAAGGANGLYASQERLFLYAQRGSETDVHGFALTDAGPVYQGSGSVTGQVGWQNTTFRFSAVGDYLRVVSSVDRDHRLTVLQRNESTNRYDTVSTLPNAQRPAPIGKPNESIYGVRFMQDRAYVVTFLRTDPLYVINLSDPEDPFIEGELEIPGYSDYLHPVNDYLLLGVGRAANDEGLLEGVKLALFDVSNTAAPTTLAAADIGDRGSRTPVSYDHKAFTWLPNAETGIHRFAIPVRKFEIVPEQGVFSSRSATVLSLWEIEDNVTSGTLTAQGEVDAPEYGRVMRGVIDETSVHFVVDETIVSADWSAPDAVSINLNARPETSETTD